ncbi:DEAD-box ATP-dependent RNA helicase 53 [Frankliniella fusca]|uniref:DEAD-box ATP-dependent RNA helicase 53 n=1 Tax=Frankliniella fusca TaxID=407009 RepID=A0AAE1LGJ4_9NEOP|nr:DEAD-box ATP-dependent RNA helicase 53 [Frankliniella fusca]
MKYDAVYREILGDNLILEFGRRKYDEKNNDSSPNYRRYVKDRMRELGRFMGVVKQKAPGIRGLVDLFCATKYRLTSDPTNTRVHAPSSKYDTSLLVLKLKQSLLKCCYVYRGMCLDNFETHGLVKSIDMYESRLQKKFKGDCSKLAHKTLEENKWNAEDRLPVASDVKKLHDNLKKEERKFKDALEVNPTEDFYRKLTEVVLCQIIMLNRRRVGEVQFMTLDQYEKALKLGDKEDEEVAGSLSEMEKALVKRLQLIYIIP